MLAQERQKIIMDMFKKSRILKTSEIAEKFGISNLTARRDLDELADKNLVNRIYGGAMLVDSPALIFADVPEERSEIEQERIAEMEAIGKMAASLVEEGDTVFLGNGRMPLEVAKHLADVPNLTFIVSSMPLANFLLSVNQNVFILGGFIDPNEHSMNNYTALQIMEKLNPNKTFIDCAGMDVEQGVTAESQMGAEIGWVAVRNAEKAFLVVSSRKIGKKRMYKVCSLSDLDAVITDDHLSKEKRKALEKAGVKMYYTESQNQEKPAE